MAGKRLVLVIPDGMADLPLADHGGRTPLEMVPTPAMDALASSSVVGTVKNVPAGMSPGSDIAIMSLLGYDPAKYHTGRAPLEAAGMGIPLGQDDVAWRCNLVTLDPDDGAEIPGHRMRSYSAGHIGDLEGRAIVEDLQRELGDDGLVFHPGVSYRHLLLWRGGPSRLLTTPPHDITDRMVDEHLPDGDRSGEVLGLMDHARDHLISHPVNTDRRARGDLPANSIWLWGQGARPSMPTMSASHGLSGSIITAVNLVRGLGVLAGLTPVDVPGATGYIDTNYEGKADAALAAVREGELVVVHIEAPDEAGHGGNLDDKRTAIRDFDSRFLARLIDGLHKIGPFRLLLLPDHPTPLATKTHSSDPVPFLLYDSDLPASGPSSFSEATAAATGLSFASGPALFLHFIGRPA
jgi:2,3-bisphosphoglycerate-independent phosphoglycerate mutase